MKFLKPLFAFLFVFAGLLAEQKVVLISGATSGIGLATAKAFQEKGWKVWAGFRQRIPDELKTMENVSLCPLDVTNDLHVQTAIEMILKKDGKIDALINNAGYGLIGAEECVSLKEAQQLFDVNFFGCLRLIQAVLPTMRRERSGHIINISSGVGIHSLPGLGLYSASKFALEGLSESLAATLFHWNIKVSVVEPGFVKNDWGKHCVVGSRTCNEEFYKNLNQGICTMLSVPQGQPSRDIAALIVEIAETPQPLVRYQTSPDMKEWIREKLVDPTGMTSQRDNLEFINHRIENK
jgi:NADP-dependent 3-hydroxy acid dehydrogenase YdfG